MTQKPVTMYFPPEIISAILYHQSKHELKKGRLVCKTFDTAAVPFLFDEIRVVARYATMEKVTLVASRFGRFVKTLIFCSEAFEPDQADLAFSRIWQDGPHCFSYRKLREEREELLDGTEFFGHLCSILIALSNLQKVVLTDMYQTPGECWCHQAYVDGHSRTFSPWSDERYSMLRSWRPAPDHRCLASNWGLNRMDSNAWAELLQALFISKNTKVKSIVTAWDTVYSGLDISVFGMTPRQRFCAAEVLFNLTSLHLHLDNDSVVDLVVTRDIDNKLYSERLVAKTLSAAINLKSLIIELAGELTPEEGAQDRTTTFDMILRDCKMPKLVTFNLRCFSINEVEMTTFLQHSHEIRYMSLDEVEMVSGFWENVFQTIKDNLPLKTITIMDLYGGTELSREESFGGSPFGGSPAIEKFLFGDGLNPFSKAALEVVAAELLT